MAVTRKEIEETLMGVTFGSTGDYEACIEHIEELVDGAARQARVVANNRLMTNMKTIGQYVAPEDHDARSMVGRTVQLCAFLVRLDF